jgi:hypothetical protein
VKIGPVKQEILQEYQQREMKYMRRTTGYTWTDDKTNTEIAKELNINSVLDKIQDCRTKLIQILNRVPRNRLPKLIKKLHPKRSQGRPLKRLVDA